MPELSVDRPFVGGGARELPRACPACVWGRGKHLDICGRKPVKGDILCYEPNVTYREAGETFMRLLQAGAIRMVKPGPKRVAPYMPQGHWCECGRPISNGKISCRACLMREVEKAAHGIRTTDELEMFLANFEPADRPGMEALVKPIMMERWENPAPVDSDESWEASAALMEMRT